MTNTTEKTPPIKSIYIGIDIKQHSIDTFFFFSCKLLWTLSNLIFSIFFLFFFSLKWVITHDNNRLTSRRRLPGLKGGRCHFGRHCGGGGGGDGSLDGTFFEISGGHALTTRTHCQSGCWERLTTMGRDYCRWAHFHGPQLLNLSLKPPILLCQWPKPSLQVLTFHLCLF